MSKEHLMLVCRSNLDDMKCSHWYVGIIMCKVDLCSVIASAWGYIVLYPRCYGRHSAYNPQSQELATMSCLVIS